MKRLFSILLVLIIGLGISTVNADDISVSLTVNSLSDGYLFTGNVFNNDDLSFVKNNNVEVIIEYEGIGIPNGFLTGDHNFTDDSGNYNIYVDKNWFLDKKNLRIQTFTQFNGFKYESQIELIN
jgi:hypothetical protein